MKKKIGDVILCIILAVVFPYIVSNISAEYAQKKLMENSAESIPTSSVTESDPVKIQVIMPDQTVRTMELEEYVTAVVLREMPADFELEALKAQAVVARTYTLRRMQSGGKHEIADVCADPSCCQGYYDTIDYLADGGTEALLQCVKTAVTDTAGLTLCYNGELIEATYFSCSGGMTEDAAAVWGTDIPYLKAVKSPGEEIATHYTETVVFSSQEFQKQLGRDLDGFPAQWIEDISYTPGNGVKTIRICGRDYTGTEIRELLGLRSTSFTISATGDNIVITTKGFGHRVGMSQYGAEAMAVQGSSFEEILLYYYDGVELVSYGSID